ncbi:transglycosylase domain-containing protein [Modestobacter sp. URMC 112]
MPPHDATSPVGPRGGSARRPAPSRSAGSSGGGAQRPAAGGGRPRPPASRGGTPARGAGGGRPPAGSRPGAGSRGGGGGGRPPGGRPPARGAAGGGKRKPSPKQRRRRVLAWLAGIVAAAAVLLGVFVGVVYASTEVPTPDSIQNDQTTVVYYADGVTEMARLAADDGNRTNVTLDQVSEPARNAILAAENRNFYSDPGISPTGIARAAWNNLTGGSTQGGSTITQQYVKNAFLTSDQTFSRKFKELFLAVKLDNQYSKDEILENYLNTIYFGRGAYGIEAAANTYFGIPAAQLTAEQGAVLAVLVRSPSGNDPETNPEGALSRWELVLDAMVEQQWVDSAAREAMVYPPVLPRGNSNLGVPEGPEGLIVEQVRAELTGPDHGYSEEDVLAGGLRITTTVDKARQDAAVDAVNTVMDGEPVDVLRQALVSIDPRTGAVVAYYGGNAGSGFDYASNAYRQPGSSMKPYALATALQQGISVTARRDGTSPQEFPDRPGLPVANASNAQCAACTLKEAITKSLNTTFYGLAYEVGADNVRETAMAAMDLPDQWTAPGNPDVDGKPVLSRDGFTGGAIGIGEYELRPIDQAHGFATFAAGGLERDPYFVARVTDTAGTVLIQKDGDPGEQVIPADVANDVTFALEDVASTAKRGLDDGRPVASKTGTQGLNRSDNSDAWMVGYTPSLSTAVWMGSDARLPIKNASGAIIYGSGLPGAIWQRYMDAALAGTPEEPLPTRALIKGDTGRGVPEPTPEPTAAPTTVQPAPVTTEAPAPAPAPTTTSTAPPPEDEESDETGQPTAPPGPPTAPGQPSAPGPGGQPAPTAGRTG